MTPALLVYQSPVAPISARKLSKIISNGNGWMAASESHEQPRQPWSLDDLSSELLALIFSLLRDIDNRSLTLARLLSRRFNDIITPIKYEYLCLTEQIIAPQAQLHLPDALEYIYRYTRHVEIRSNLDPQGIKSLLERLQRLSTVRWTYVGGNFRSGSFWMPSDVLCPQRMQYQNTKLYIDNLPLRHFAGDQQDSYFNAIPTNVLKSLKLASPTPPLTHRLESLKELLLRSTQLETFHYQDRGQGTRFAFAEDEVLPAFKELTLRSYDWSHSADEVENHWDFSRIRSLKLIDVPIYEFLVSVHFGDLVDLHTLQCEDFSAHLPDRRREASHGLYCLVKNIQALRTLKITCHTELFHVDALVRHAHTLEVLKLRDHVGFGEEYRRCPTIWHKDLEMLSRTLVNLHTLELDMDVALCEPPLFLRALVSFSKLHSLTLHVQTVLRAFEVVHPNVDQDYEAALKTFRTLMREKVGCRWRRITINVGGWRRHMIRRLSEAWRSRNSEGVYAERCFVLERNSTGDMMVREELAFEQ